jgi:hypothetical protein
MAVDNASLHQPQRCSYRVPMAVKSMLKYVSAMTQIIPFELIFMIVAGIFWKYLIPSLSQLNTVTILWTMYMNVIARLKSMKRLYRITTALMIFFAILTFVFFLVVMLWVLT